jgi:hypothetical protein
MSKMISKKYLNIFVANNKIMHISSIIYKYNFTLRSCQKDRLQPKLEMSMRPKIWANLFIFGELVQNFHFGWGGATIHHQSFHLMV